MIVENVTRFCRDSKREKLEKRKGKSSIASTNASVVIPFIGILSQISFVRQHDTVGLPDRKGHECKRG